MIDCERCGKPDSNTIDIGWSDDLSHHHLCKECESDLQSLIAGFVEYKP